MLEVSFESKLNISPFSKLQFELPPNCVPFVKLSYKESKTIDLENFINLMSVSIVSLFLLATRSTQLLTLVLNRSLCCLSFVKVEVICLIIHCTNGRPFAFFLQQFLAVFLW